jgi:hypothetical protein
MDSPLHESEGKRSKNHNQSGKNWPDDVEEFVGRRRETCLDA